MIRKCRLKNGQEIEIRRLTVNQIDELLALQEEVIAALTSTSSLQPLSIEEFSYILNGKGFMIGAYCEGQLIAFRAMLEPKTDDDHLGKDAGLPENAWSSVIYSEITNVKPSFRGNGLQVLLGEIIMKEVDTDRFCYICATVAPFNIPSLKDKLTLGLQIVALKEKYTHMLRYVLMKDLSNERKYSVQCTVSMDDTEEQQRLLENNWIGTSIEKVEDMWKVKFEK